MWPYTECEWNFVTHGVKKNKKKVSNFKKYKTIVWASIVPSLTLVWILSQLF